MVYKFTPPPNDISGVSLPDYYSSIKDDVEKQNDNLKRNSYYYLEWLDFQQNMILTLVLVYYLVCIVCIITFFTNKNVLTFVNGFILLFLFCFPYLLYHYLLEIVITLIDQILDYLPNNSALYSDIN